MNGVVVATLIAAAAFSAAGQLLLKIGATGKREILEFLNSYVVAGLVVYLPSVALGLYGMSRAPLYAVYSFTVLAIVMVGVLAAAILGERPGALALVGWAVIAAGVAFVYADAG